VKPHPPGSKLGLAAEAAVVALARAGDDEAFEELVRRRQGWLRRLLRRLCDDAALADDLAQQSLLRGWQTLAGLRDCAAFGPWLQRLAVNLWLQHLRRRAPAALSLEQDGCVLQQAQSAESGTAVAERLDLEAALARLAPLCRLCIVLGYAEGMSHADISSLTGLPPGTVKSHIRRGSAQLRSLLHAYEERERMA